MIFVYFIIDEPKRKRVLKNYDCIKLEGSDEVNNGEYVRANSESSIIIRRRRLRRSKTI